MILKGDVEKFLILLIFDINLLMVRPIIDYTNNFKIKCASKVAIFNNINNIDISFCINEILVKSFKFCRVLMKVNLSKTVKY